MGVMHGKSPRKHGTRWCPIAKLVYKYYYFTRVDEGVISIVNGDDKITNITGGAPPCRDG